MNKKIVKHLLKIILSGAGLYFVFTKIDFSLVSQEIKNVKIGWLLLAILFFHLSKIIASFRLLKYYNAIDIFLSIKDNIRLLYIGMFYNLFLPGSVGGDGYKVYLIKQNSEAKTKRLISAALLDRLSGLAILFVLSGILLLGTGLIEAHPWVNIAAWVLIIGTLPVFYIFKRVVFYNGFSEKFISTTLISLAVQTGQLVCAFCVLQSIGVEQHYLDYLTLFMLSSVVAVLPFTVGGVGARELVFLYGYQYLNIDNVQAVSFTLLFFATLALTSLTGLLFTFGKDEYNTSK